MSAQAPPASPDLKDDVRYRLITETELIDPSSLSLSTIQSSKPTVHLNPSAHGWSRRPLGDTRLYSGLGALMRNKRWEYYGITTPKHVIGITLSSLEYAGVNQLFILDRESNNALSKEVIAPLARGVNLPDTYGPDTTASFESKDLSIRIVESHTESERVTSITASATVDSPSQERNGKGHEISIVLNLTRPITSDALHVVVPWNSKQFQYTIKEPAIPCTGTVTIDGVVHRIDTSDSAFAVLDHGRGRWPYSMVWNWAAGSGISSTSTGQRIGLQLGAKWTEGTGSTENAIIIDGTLIKISEELTWEYDTRNWMKPWRITGRDLDATFTPFYERVTKTNLVVLSGETHQLFGRWEGVFRLGGEDGVVISLDGLEGWAEEARNCW